MMKRFWQAEPILATVLGSAAVWSAVFALIGAFGHPLTGVQEAAITGLITAVGAIVGRSQVTPTNF